MIIDSHCHAGTGFGLNDPWDGHPLLEKYLRRAFAAGISHSVLFANFHDDYASANRSVARIVNTNPQRFFGFAYVHAQHDKGRIHTIVRTAVQDYGFVGIKIHRHDSRISWEVCEAARAYALPVLYDIENELPIVDLLAMHYSDVNFIIPHLGSFNENWRTQKALIERLEIYPNIYADSSGVRYFDLLARAVERCGAEKILFGSDGPWLHPGVELAKIRALRLPVNQENLILGGNFLNLISAAWRRQASPLTESLRI